MPIAIVAEQRAIQASIRQWAAKADPVTTVRALEPGTATAPDWAGHWADLTRLGVFSVALPEQAGGDGGSACDLAAALEQVTDALVPGPIMPTVLAGLVLAPHRDIPAVKGLLPELAAGAASVAVALRVGHDERDPATRRWASSAWPGRPGPRCRGHLAPAARRRRRRPGRRGSCWRPTIPAYGCTAGHPSTSPARWPTSSSTTCCSPLRS